MLLTSTNIILLAIIASLAVSLFISVLNYWNKKNQLSISRRNHAEASLRCSSLAEATQLSSKQIELERAKTTQYRLDVINLKGDLSIAKNKIISLEADLKVHKPKQGPDGKFIKKAK